MRDRTKSECPSSRHGVHRGKNHKVLAATHSRPQHHTAATITVPTASSTISAPPASHRTHHTIFLPTQSTQPTGHYRCHHFFRCRRTDIYSVVVVPSSVSLTSTRKVYRPYKNGTPNGFRPTAPQTQQVHDAATAKAANLLLPPPGRAGVTRPRSPKKTPSIFSAVMMATSPAALEAGR